MTSHHICHFAVSLACSICCKSIHSRMVLTHTLTHPTFDSLSFECFKFNSRILICRFAVLQCAVLLCVAFSVTAAYAHRTASSTYVPNVIYMRHCSWWYLFCFDLFSLTINGIWSRINLFCSMLAHEFIRTFCVCVCVCLNLFLLAFVLLLLLPPLFFWQKLILFELLFLCLSYVERRRLDFKHLQWRLHQWCCLLVWFSWRITRGAVICWGRHAIIADTFFTIIWCM